MAMEVGSLWLYWLWCLYKSRQLFHQAIHRWWQYCFFFLKCFCFYLSLSSSPLFFPPQLTFFYCCKNFNFPHPTLTDKQHSSASPRPQPATALKKILIFFSRCWVKLRPVRRFDYISWIKAWPLRDKWALVWLRSTTKIGQKIRNEWGRVFDLY